LYRINPCYYSDTGYRSVKYRSVVQPLLEAMQSVASWGNVNILTQEGDWLAKEGDWLAKEGDWLAKEWKLYTFWR